MASTLTIDTENDRALLAERVPVLIEMSSFKFASSLWTNVMLSGKHHDYDDTLHNAVVITLPIVLKLIKRLKAPQVVKNQLMKSVSKMRTELDLWINYHRDVLLGCRTTFRTCHLKCCLWKSNCDIDYKETARKMVSMGFFGKVQNFEILCKFCIEDELNKLSIDDELRGYFDGLEFHKETVACYWGHKLTNKLSSVWATTYIINDNGYLESVDSNGEDAVANFVLTAVSVDDWHCFEYFFNLLSQQMQVRVAAIKVEVPNSCFNFRKLLRNMNESQRRTIFTAVPVQIIMLFFKQFDEPEKAFVIWTRIKQSLIGDQFAYLIHIVLNEMNDGNPAADAFFKKLWYSADDRLKAELLEYEDGFIGKNFFAYQFIAKFDSDLRFMFDLMSSAPINYRKKTMFEMGFNLIVVKDLSRVDEIIELCLPDAGDVAKFKQTVAKSPLFRVHCTAHFQQGYFSYVNQLLERYVADKSSANEMKKEILEFGRSGCNVFIFGPDVWSEFEEFVDTIDSDESQTKFDNFVRSFKQSCICSETADSGESYVTSVKKRFVRSFKLDYFCICSHGHVEEIDQLETMVSRFLTKKEICHMKKTLSSSLRDHFTRFVESCVIGDEKFFSGIFLEKLVKWCSTGTEKVSEFKRTIPVDEIFSKSITALLSLIREDQTDEGKIVSNCRENIDGEKLLAVDEFLKWYLDGEEAAKEYKLSKLFEFNEELLKCLADAAEIDEQDTRSILVWFLANDREQMSRFKSKCNNEAISSFF